MKRRLSDINSPLPALPLILNPFFIPYTQCPLLLTYNLSLVSFVIHKIKICFITKKTNNYNGFEMNIDDDFGITKHFFVLMESQRFHGVRKVKKHGQRINQFDTPQPGRRKV